MEKNKENEYKITSNGKEIATVERVKNELKIKWNKDAKGLCEACGCDCGCCD